MQVLLCTEAKAITPRDAGNEQASGFSLSTPVFLYRLLWPTYTSPKRWVVRKICHVIIVDGRDRRPERHTGNNTGGRSVDSSDRWRGSVQVSS